uniref:hypothetical protein n=1 Tax=Flavobacterium sp. TaxID=239 RepID=UPI0040478F45
MPKAWTGFNPKYRLGNANFSRASDSIRPVLRNPFYKPKPVDQGLVAARIFRNRQKRVQFKNFKLPYVARKAAARTIQKAYKSHKRKEKLDPYIPRDRRK